MRRGQLSEFFLGQAAKRLSAVEADPARSNQREFNGVGALARILGPSVPRRSIDAQFIYLDDDEDRIRTALGTVTWYDARERHPTRSEDRLYFTPTSVSDAFQVGDLLVIGVRRDGTLMVIVAARGTTSADQLRWLFGFGALESGGFEIRDEADSDKVRLNIASRRLLEEIGIDAAETAEDRLTEMIDRFGGTFPRTREFSAYARSTVPSATPKDDPDAVLLSWIEREEALFRTLERYIVSKRLKQGFPEDAVDEFVAYSLSVQNRRKARAGGALQNHVLVILEARRLRFGAQAVTEGRSTTDFLFPGLLEYRNPEFPAERLAMLGVKSSCKDRWRQVLAEAARVPRKHLLTLEPGITAGQTNEMEANNLQLVVPAPLHSTYSVANVGWLWSVADFLDFIKARE